MLATDTIYEQVATVNKTVSKLLPMRYKTVLTLSKKDALYYSDPTVAEREFLRVA